MDKKGRVSWQEWLLLLGFVLSIAVAGVFLARALHVARTMHADEPIRPWMTIPYVARSYRVPAATLYQALGTEPRTHDRRPLSAIARAQHRPVEEVIAELQAAIKRERAAAPTAPPQPGGGKP
jgi:hypothetical protein